MNQIHIHMADGTKNGLLNGRNGCLYPIRRCLQLWLAAKYGYRDPKGRKSKVQKNVEQMKI